MPGKGQESGQTTADEHKRIEQAGNHAKACRKTDEPAGSGTRVRSKRAAREAPVTLVSQAWSAGLDLEAAWAGEQQSPGRGDQAKGTGPVEEQVPGFWTDAGVREAGGAGRRADLG